MYMETHQLSSQDSDYAKRRKQHLALINQLRAIGAQADLDLPRIAVIGNQSAGKSSLVEAISGINVPRDAGTCTRCPMECRLSSSSGEWQCQVSIRWEFNEDGSPKDEVHEVPFAGIIKDKKKVELFLRRAQLAVLNPGIDSPKFLSKSLEGLKSMMQNQLLFSKNAICLDLTGPDLTDLAFIDLPGIIQNADFDTVQLVEDLVLSHIRGNCIILVTLPMSDDIENQKAARLARMVDENGRRTIGVMTKPDTLTSGATKSRDLWLDVIEGRRFPLRHGYFCTRQPDDDERTNGITSAQARAAELDFFSKTSPWNRSTHQSRFGTNNLITSLSKLLSQIIDDTLPKLQGEVSKQLSTCNSRLAMLPPPITSEPSAYVLSLVTAFCQDISKYVRGDAQCAGLVQQNRRTYAVFKKDIRSTAPQFLPFANARETGGDAERFLGWGEDDEDDSAVDEVGTGPKGSRYLYLQDIRKHIEKSLARELPHNVPYSAKTALIQSSQTSWEMDSQKCFDAVHEALDKTLARLINRSFERYDHLKSRLMHIVMGLVKSKREGTWTSITDLLQYEKVPFTQNGHYLQVTKDKYLAKYKDARAGKAVLSKPAARSNGGPAMKRLKNNVQEERRAQENDHETTPESRPHKKARDVSAPDLPPPPSTPQTSKKTAPRPTKPLPKRAPQKLHNSSSSSFGDSSPARPSQHSQSSSTQAGSSPSVRHRNDSAGEDSSEEEAEEERDESATAQPCQENSVNEHSHANRQDVFNQLQKRDVTLDDVERETHEKTALAALAALGYNISALDFGKLNPPDIYGPELEVMAEVRAYFHVSYKRVIDYVPLAIDHTFLFAFADSLQAHLIEKLGLGTANAAARCAAYLAEDPSVVAEREELAGKVKRLESVQVELFNFGL